MNETGETILVVDDDPEIAQLVTDALEPRGYRIVHAATGAELKDRLQEGTPDLILLDIMLPDSDGLVLCADLHQQLDVPIIICSGTQRKRDSVLGFKLGADDFLAKPFHVEELEARVEAVMRRTAQRRQEGLTAVPVEAPSEVGELRVLPPRPAPLRVGSLTIDDARRQVTVGDRLIELTPTEYRLLSILASHLSEVLSRQELSSLVWGYQDASIGRSIDVHVHRLRSKLGIADGEWPQIVSVRGFGYKMIDEGQADIDRTA